MYDIVFECTDIGQQYSVIELMVCLLQRLAEALPRGIGVDLSQGASALISKFEETYKVTQSSYLLASYWYWYWNLISPGKSFSQEGTCQGPYVIHVCTPSCNIP